MNIQQLSELQTELSYGYINSDEYKEELMNDSRFSEIYHIIDNASIERLPKVVDKMLYDSFEDQTDYEAESEIYNSYHGRTNFIKINEKTTKKR